MRTSADGKRNRRAFFTPHPLGYCTPAIWVPFHEFLLTAASKPLPSKLMEHEQFNRISRALADPRRMEILERIASEKEVACSVLANESSVSQPTISHHLKELAYAGLIKPRKEARFSYYCLDSRVWNEYLAEMKRRIPAKRF